MECEMKIRYYWMDNMRALLIFLVVLGHLCEIVKFPGRASLYDIIYAFHMPAFCFLSGMCCRPYNAVGILKRYLYPYIVFQSLYILFANEVLHRETAVQFATPYWLLWYLPALAVWDAAVYLMPEDRRKLLLLLAGSSVLSLLIGYDSSVSYYMSLSRIVVYFPFFLGGYLLKCATRPRAWLETEVRTRHFRMCIFAAAGSAVALVAVCAPFIRSSWLYNAMPYEAKDYSPWIRATFSLTAVLCILFLWSLVPNRRLPFISYIGRNTMPVYLLHGFVVRWLSGAHLLKAIVLPQLAVLGIAIACLALLSCPPVQAVLCPLWQLPTRGAQKRLHA